MTSTACGWCRNRRRHRPPRLRQQPSDYAAASAADLRAVEAMGAALEGSDKPFVVTSGTLAVAFRYIKYPSIKPFPIPATSPGPHWNAQS